MKNISLRLMLKGGCDQLLSNNKTAFLHLLIIGVMIIVMKRLQPTSSSHHLPEKMPRHPNKRNVFYNCRKWIKIVDPEEDNKLTLRYWKRDFQSRN